jgi:hypothetical protein
MSHTPGPWLFCDDNGPDRNIWAGTTVIATTDGDSVACETANANARLIAAAPELLSALKLCLYTLKQMLSDGYFHYIGAEHEIENATNAINKAEGKPCNLTYDDIAPK